MRYPERMPWEGQKSRAASVRVTRNKVSEQDQQQAVACVSWPQQQGATGGLVC